MIRRVRRAHGRIWMVLGLLLPLSVLAALALRQTAPADRQPVLLEPASNDGADG
ncbi:MAG: hypothetical protein AAF638_02150 [Pseudomonadota bacterium]